MVKINPKYADAIFTPQFVYAELVEAVEANILPGRARDEDIKKDPAASPCQYETKDGHKCAVGVFIVNGPSTGGVESLFDKNPELAKLMCGGGVDERKWNHLQASHDQVSSPINWGDGSNFLADAKSILGV